MAQFDKDKDKIAVALKSFAMNKKTEGFIREGRYEEPYIVALAADAHGVATPQLQFSTRPFPKVKVGDSISFQGHGHLIYGPKQPGDFAAFSILFMESDDDIRAIGERVGEIVRDDRTKAVLKAVMVANPGAAAVLTGLEQVTGIVADAMAKNKDDKLFLTGGTLLRDIPSAPPYDIGMSTTQQNDYITCETEVIPLSAGKAPRTRGLESAGEEEMFSSIEVIDL